MGLDMKVLGKPKPGHEQEFHALFDQLVRGAPPPKRGFLDRLLKRPEMSRDEKIARFLAVSEPHFSSIGAPVVGQDAAANDWVCTAFANGNLTHFETADAAIAGLDGYCALQAMPDCDGFSTYTHAYAYEGVDRASFRGKFLEDCADILPHDLIGQAWETMTADELAVWAHAVRERAQSAAVTNNAMHVLGQHEIEDELGSPARAVHIADSAARWAAFWSSRGHGSEAYF